MKYRGNTARCTMLLYIACDIVLFVIPNLLIFDSIYYLKYTYIYGYINILHKYITCILVCLTKFNVHLRIHSYCNYPFIKFINFTYNQYKGHSSCNNRGVNKNVTQWLVVTHCSHCSLQKQDTFDIRQNYILYIVKIYIFRSIFINYTRPR